MASSDKNAPIDKPEGSTVNPDLSKPLQTEVRAASNPQERKYGSDGTFKDTVNVGAAAGAYESLYSQSQPHSAEYYEQWRKDTQQKLDKGEDYYADFARRARENSNQNSVTGRLITGLKSKFGKKDTKEQPETAGGLGVEPAQGSGSSLFGKKEVKPDEVIR